MYKFVDARIISKNKTALPTAHDISELSKGDMVYVALEVSVNKEFSYTWALITKCEFETNLLDSTFDVIILSPVKGTFLKKGSEEKITANNISAVARI